MGMTAWGRKVDIAVFLWSCVLLPCVQRTHALELGSDERKSEMVKRVARRCRSGTVAAAIRMIGACPWPPN
jgi:hypothetical protein